jgi:acylphosphatase
MPAYVATKLQRHHLCPATPVRFSSTIALCRHELEDLGMVCKKCLVGGRVQGVFYRATAARRARELGIDGHARNLPDGRVEVMACGDEAAVGIFVEWLWTGSSASRVTSVEVSDAALEAANVRPGFRTA